MRRLLFGSRPDWEAGIRVRLDPVRYSVAFRSLHNLDADAFDAVIPLNLDDYAALWGRPMARPRYLIPAAETVALCHDKIALNNFLIRHGLGEIVPALYPDAATSHLPYMLKKAEDEGGSSTFVVHRREDDADYAARIGGARLFRQEAIPGGTEFAAHFLAVDGEILFHTHVRYRAAGELAVHGVRHTPIGNAVMPELELDPWLARAVRLLRYTGTGCIDYKMLAGVPRLFEINPRFGWSLSRDINRYLDCYLDAIGLSLLAGPVAGRNR